MIYQQTVTIKNRNIEKVIDSFHKIDFIKFLISFQPVRIIKWDGIENDLTAHLKFWLLKWHSFTSLKPGSDIKGVPASLTIPILIPERSLRIIYGLFLEALLSL